jgi:hypothetical protein
MFLKKYDTENYSLDIRDSAVRDFEGEIYHVVNKHTLVSEHETPYFSEALGYILALDQKFGTAIAAFNEEQNKEKVKIPSFED